MMRALIIVLMLVVWTGYPTVSVADEGSDADNKQCEGKKDGTPVKSKTRDIEGTCQGGKFNAEKAGGQALDKAFQALMQALQSAMGGKGGGGSGGGSGGGAPQGQTPTNNPLGGAGNILGSLTGSTTGNIRSSVSDILNGVFQDDAESRTTILETQKEEEGSDTTIRAVVEGDEEEGSSSGNRTTVTNVTNTTVTGVSGDDVKNTLTQPSGDGEQMRGDIVNRGDSATVEGGISSPGKNTEVAGFFGVNTGTGSAASGLVGRVCSSRPWANSFLSYLVSDSFFDGLCRRLGFDARSNQINEPVNTTAAERNAVKKTEEVKREEVAAVSGKRTVGIACTPNIIRTGTQASLDFSCKQGATLTAVAGFSAKSYADTTAVVSPTKTTQYGIQCSDGIVYTCTVEVINPKLTIWAEPKEASLGSRVEIYWTTSDVVADTCSVRGPSFSERGPTGGAATVPINDPSTFTLTCLARDGATTTSSVLVDLAL